MTLRHVVGVDFGWGWRGRGRRRDGLLSWWPNIGAVVVDGPDGLDVLGYVGDLDDLRRRLDGWEEVIYQPVALEWARARITAPDGG